MEITIREFNTTDSRKLDRLFTELGYPTTNKELSVRLDKLMNHKDYFALVVEHNQRIIGFCGMCRMMFFERDGNYMRILAFIIDSEYRNKGIGSRLLIEAEKFSQTKHCTVITLNSGNREERNIAHQFYISNDYILKSSGFVKIL
ncbi:GNAT family N-acetyltransferase [Macrococcus equipercicus]|uniref:GNAT family N-acetyltransferase n=1 Tax=Macrococcus equipercicus TaxID=69967 RepID=A0A9Q9F1M4_9STAP|nr:GNAT family N-acetyltransferase [Macrococcus equipercicus]KAA1037588.1 GNAT family N-acetyltransferase [Macrococcus equipercicus]UTH14097.1 GNAT family N-acetyltransferase [Macrococcus equipercicus]